MTTTEFLKGRALERQALTRYIKRHEEEFEGHIFKNGKELELDEVAVQLLEEQYPLPAPVQVVNGVPHEEYERVLNELVKAREELVKKNEEITELVKKTALADANQLLLEDRSKQLDQARLMIEEQQAEVTQLHQENSQVHQKNDELENELGKFEKKFLNFYVKKV